MLTRVLLGARACRQTLVRQCRRNLGLSAVISQKAAEKIDPIQQLFLDKVREYSKKSKAAGDTLVDVSPEGKKALQEDLDKITKVYGAEGVDFTQFPSFSFSDPDLEPVGVSFEVKEATQLEVESREQAESQEEKPYFEL